MTLNDASGGFTPPEAGWRQFVSVGRRRETPARIGPDARATGFLLDVDARFGLLSVFPDGFPMSSGHLFMHMIFMV